MIRLRRLAIVMIAVGLIVGAVYATGAFTTITTQRDANVRVAGDDAGYLALQSSDGPNGAYAAQRDGKLRVSLSGALSDDGPSGKGVNREATTVVENVFTITNKGTQPVGVWVSDESDAVSFETDSHALEGREQAVTIDPGKSIAVGLTVDTHNTDEETLLSSVEIHADAEASGSESSSTDDGNGNADSMEGGGDGSSSAEENAERRDNSGSQSTGNDSSTNADPPEPTGGTTAEELEEKYGIDGDGDRTGSQSGCQPRTRSTYVPSADYCGEDTEVTTDPEDVVKTGAPTLAVTTVNGVPGDEVAVGLGISILAVTAYIFEQTDSSNPADSDANEPIQLPPGHGEAPRSIEDGQNHDEGPPLQAPGAHSDGGPRINLPNPGINLPIEVPGIGNKDESPTIETVEGPNGEEVDIDKNHANREDGDHPSYEKSKETVENPDEIWEKGPHRTYIKQIDGEWVTVRSYDLGEKYNGGTSVKYKQYEEDKSTNKIVSVEGYLISKDYQIPEDKMSD